MFCLKKNEETLYTETNLKFVTQMVIRLWRPKLVEKRTGHYITPELEMYFKYIGFEIWSQLMQKENHRSLLIGKWKEYFFTLDDIGLNVMKTVV